MFDASLIEQCPNHLHYLTLEGGPMEIYCAMKIYHFQEHTIKVTEIFGLW